MGVLGLKKFKNKRTYEAFCNEDVRGVPPDVLSGRMTGYG
jgi:hypothetical protein